MKKIKYLVSSILMLILLCFFVPFRAMAASSEENNNPNDLRQYSHNNPSMTFFTPGQGCTAAIWENYEFRLAADSVSFVERISSITNGDIYLASLSGKDNISYTLQKLDRSNQIKDKNGTKIDGMYQYSFTKVENIINLYKHNIILFQSDEPAESHDYVYSQFEFLVNSLYNHYNDTINKLPKINLIGHSRGGIINLMYATKHPYNVSSLVSFGTPYNGSRFGRITRLARLLGLDESLNCPSGKDIQNKNIQKQLKDNWNTMLENHPDANINAIAYQSSTTLDLIIDMIKSGELDSYIKDSNDSHFKTILIDFAKDLSACLLSVLNDFPNVTTTIIKASTKLGLNFADFVNGNEKDDELEALREVFDNVYSYYGEVVLYDDMFIDYESQGAEGYNGFIKENKIFKEGSYDFSKKCVNEPGIPHNLEARDTEMISKMISVISFGEPSEYLGSIQLNKEINSNVKNYCFSYTPNIDSAFKINSNAISYITVKNTLDGNLVDIENNVLYMKKGIKYVFYASSDSDLSSCMLRYLTLDEVMNNSYRLNGKESICLTIPNSGLINLDVNNDLICLQALNDLYEPILNRKSKLIFDALTANYLYIKNTSNSEITINLANSVSETISIGNNSVNSNQKVFKFVAPKEYVYIMTLYTGYNYEIKVYNQEQNNRIGLAKITKSDKKVYTISLEANQTVYVFIEGNEDIGLDLKLEYSVYQWSVNGNLINENEYHIINNNIDSLTLSYCLNGEKLIGNLIVDPRNEIYTSVKKLNEYEHKVSYRNPNVISFKNEDILISFVLEAGENDILLGNIILIVDPYFDVKLEQNDLLIDDYKLNVINNSNNYIGNMEMKMKFKVENSISHSISYITYLGGEFGTISFNTSNLKFMSGTNRVTLYEVSIGSSPNICTYLAESNKHLFRNSVVSASENCYIDNGDGSYSNPYKISSQRELQNISHLVTYDSLARKNYIAGYFRQTSNIFMRGIFNPINTLFMGSYDGGSYKISGIELTNNASGSLGLFKNVENAHFYNMVISTSALSFKVNSYFYFGYICGTARWSTFTDCSVINSAVYCTESSENRLHVGGLVGQAESCDFLRCKSSGNNIESTGNAGGIVGYAVKCNISDCVNSSNISVKFVANFNPCAGGIVGIASQNTLIDGCENSGEIAYMGEKSDDKRLKPYMGQICGKSEGKVRIINHTINGTLNKGNLRERKNIFVVLDQTKYVDNICGNEFLTS